MCPPCRFGKLELPRDKWSLDIEWPNKTFCFVEADACCLFFPFVFDSQARRMKLVRNVLLILQTMIDLKASCFS